jgi:hypothetical protein
LARRIGEGGPARDACPAEAFVKVAHYEQQRHRVPNDCSLIGDDEFEVRRLSITTCYPDHFVYIPW